MAGARRRVGLFGGTFNPIHQGHLRGAEEILETFGLDEVIFIPAAIPPHKPAKGVIEVGHRLEMVRLATRGNPRFRVSDVEIQRSGKSYSVDTVRYFREKEPEGDFYFILGRDAFMEIETWRDFQDIFSLCNFGVMARPCHREILPALQLPESLLPLLRHDEATGKWIHSSGHSVRFVEITFLDISSTKVREMIERGRSVRYLVPDPVEAYLREYRLYEKPEG